MEKKNTSEIGIASSSSSKKANIQAHFAFSNMVISFAMPALRD